jgi:hypothetical protein
MKPSYRRIDLTRRCEAEAKVKGVATTPVYFVDDRWGGYWQCGTAHGPYTFRLPNSPAPQTRPSE